jgi:hypothetical protein
MSRGLQAWLWIMLLAPFMPWYTFPIPTIVLLVVSFPATLIIVPAQPVASLVAFGTISVLGVLWIATGIFAFFSARRREWQEALRFALTNLACALTILGTFLIANGLGPVEPFGYVSPLAFLGLAALPAAYEIARRWLRELSNRSGPDAERHARSRLRVIGFGSAVAFLTAFAAVALSAAAGIQQLPEPHFYWQEHVIRESAAATFAILGTAWLVAFLAVHPFLFRPLASRPQAA